MSPQQLKPCEIAACGESVRGCTEREIAHFNPKNRDFTLNSVFGSRSKLLMPNTDPQQRSVHMPAFKGCEPCADRAIGQLHQDRFNCGFILTAPSHAGSHEGRERAHELTCARVLIRKNRLGILNEVMVRDIQFRIAHLSSSICTLSIAPTFSVHINNCVQMALDQRLLIERQANLSDDARFMCSHSYQGVQELATRAVEKDCVGYDVVERM